jgi:hypothetical protein
MGRHELELFQDYIRWWFLKLQISLFWRYVGDDRLVYRLGYGLNGWTSIPDRGRDSSLRLYMQTCFETHPVSCTINIVALSLGIKRPKLQAGHSPLCSAEFRNVRSCTPLSIRLLGVVLDEPPYLGIQLEVP